MRTRQVQNTLSSLQAHYSLPSVSLHSGYVNTVEINFFSLLDYAVTHYAAYLGTRFKISDINVKKYYTICYHLFRRNILPEIFCNVSHRSLTDLIKLSVLGCPESFPNEFFSVNKFPC